MCCISRQATHFLFKYYVSKLGGVGRGHDLCWSFLGPNFVLDPRFFGPKGFLAKNFFGQIFSFYQNLFFLSDNFVAKILFWPKNIWSKLFLSLETPKIWLDPTLFWIQSFLALKILWIKNFFDTIFHESRIFWNLNSGLFRS